jgi:hypothetical protein
MIIIVVLSFLTLAGKCPADHTLKRKITFMQEKAEFEAEIYYKQFTIELFLKALYFQEIESPGIVYRQAIIETGWFTSELFEKANNIFGIRLARIRKTTATGEYEYHAKYQFWYDSVKDYRLLQQYYDSLGYDLTNYYVFLEKMGYATNPNYIKILKDLS